MRLSEPEVNAIVAVAASVRLNAIAPVSSYKVGAAVVADDDRVFFGCNVENASLGATLCAEAGAILSAAAGGARSLRAVVVVTTDDPPARPCGICRQRLAQLMPESGEVICANTTGRIERDRLGDLLPKAFRL